MTARQMAQAFGSNPRREVQRRLAKWFASRYGYRGGPGGWIYDAKGRSVAQGWDQFYLRMRVQIVAEIASL